MIPEPLPERPLWLRLLRLGAASAAVVLAGVLVVAGASYLGRQVGEAIETPEESQNPVAVEPGLPVTVEIPSGASGQDIAAILQAQGVIRSTLEFEVAVRNAEAAQRLKAGTYEMTTLMDPADVVAQLVAGPGPDVYRLTVIEGLRVNEILTRLAESTPHDFEDFEGALLGGEVTTSLREMPEDPSLVDWEGLLFPDTYEFARSASAASILQRMATTMEQKVNSIDWSEVEALGYTQYDGIVVASLIEAEAKVDDERPIIASVIYNRLTLGMPLDIDATVLYALGTRDIELFDRSVDSPYNTYQVLGLPPTPIAAPRLTSLQAAATPSETEFLYYVLSDFEGHHAFARTLEEHNANVQAAKEAGVLP